MRTKLYAQIFASASLFIFAILISISLHTSCNGVSEHQRLKHEQDSMAKVHEDSINEAEFEMQMKKATEDSTAAASEKTPK